MSQESGDLLAAYFPSAEAGSPTVPRSYSDNEIQEIASLLEDHEPSWSKVPRAYIVLRTIDRLDILNTLLHSGFTDYYFPVEASALPPNLQPSVRAAIVSAQHIILTKSIDLEKGENGEHRHIGKGDPQPFKVGSVLGFGGYSQVHRIRSTISFKEYALKRVRRRRAFGNNTQEAVKQFAGEIKLLKSLKHKHMAEYVGSFTDPIYFGLVMAPVAEMNLERYLDDISALSDKARESQLAILRSFFGCLAAALQFLHDQSIRHRDIKPQNILVDGSNVVFTDFGFSKQYSADVGSTTSGPTSMTARYAAPEVVSRDSRNTSSDIRSLGCVFLEMIMILKGKRSSFLYSYLSENGSTDSYVSKNLEATADILEALRLLGEAHDNLPLDLVRKMLKKERTSRITAAEIFCTLTAPDDKGSSFRFCGICCLGDEITDSDDSLCDNPDSTDTGPSIQLPDGNQPAFRIFGQISTEEIAQRALVLKTQHLQASSENRHITEIKPFSAILTPPSSPDIGSQDGPVRQVKHPDFHYEQISPPKGSHSQDRTADAFQDRADIPKCVPNGEWIWSRENADYYKEEWKGGTSTQKQEHL